MENDRSLDAIASRALSTLISGGKPQTPLSEDQQEIVFDRLAKELKRLKETERKYKHLEENLAEMPAADRFVHSDPYGRLPLKWLDDDWYTRIESDPPEMNDGERVPYDRAQDFQRLWSYPSDNELIAALSINNVEIVHWQTHQLYIEKKTSDLVCKSFPPLSEKESYVTLYHMISSQLMLYRLIVTFGPVPSLEDTDRYKGCWRLNLILCQSTEQALPSLMTFSERGGSINVKYKGSPSGSSEAMRLLKYLVSKDCAHTYDGVLAGRAA